MLTEPRLVHLHCLYCGGPRRGDDSACKKCQAAAPSVPCKRCQAQVFAPRDTCICGEPCGAWRVAAEGERACPRCSGKLKSVDVADAGVHVDQCVRCLGCFVRTEAFSELVERESASGGHGGDDRSVAAAFIPPPDATELPRQSLLDEVRCPHCREVMDRARFAQKASVVIDVCPKHGVWLDAGELPRILDHVRQVAAGEVVPDAADLADAQKWSQVVHDRLAEEHRSAARLAGRGAKDGGPSTTAVVLGTAIGGPWLGLFLAMRKRGGKK